MIMTFLLEAAVITKINKVLYRIQYCKNMACFCGCKEYEKDSNGFKVGCVKCGHGPQNHDNEWRQQSRADEVEKQSQKRDTDFG